jgi:uncharacterized protein (DUF433 family)/DNA-binding transcriptional MerR regulator
MPYAPPLAAALSGATIRQLAYWRRGTGSHGPLLSPEYGRTPRVLYSYQDIVALRMFVRLRQATSLQRIRKAVAWLQENHPDTHLSAHRIRAQPGGQTIVWISKDRDYFDIVEHPGQGGLQVVMDEVFDEFKTSSGRRVPDLARPAPGVSVDRDVRGGFPVISGTRIPYDIIASLHRDGLKPADIHTLYPAVGKGAVAGAAELAGLVAENMAS